MKLNLFSLRVSLMVVLCDGGVLDSITGYFAKEKCKIKDSYKNMIEFRLVENVQGQHIAISHVRWAMISHLLEDQPKHALSMVFAGTTGTGKNLVSMILAETVLNSENIHLYSGRLDFPDDRKVEEYRDRLKNDVTTYVSDCPYSIFIFDEIDKMPENLLDAVKPFLDFHHLINRIDYRKATFIFLTNIGGLEINTQYLALRQQGFRRQDMMYHHFERLLRQTLFEEAGLLKNSLVISDHLLSFYIPFLPQEKPQVKLCIASEMTKRGAPSSERLMNRVLENIDFSDSGISKSGCKRVAHFVAMETMRSADEL